MNNKIIFLIFSLMFLFFSCSKEIEKSHELKYQTYNQTSKEVYVCIETDTEEKGCFIYPEKTEEIVFKKTEMTKLGPFDMAKGANEQTLEIETRQIVIYNLIDTMVCQFVWGNSNKDDSLQYELFIKDRSFSIIGTSLNSEEIVKHIITDDFLNSLTEKDYSMLEKFKDYYGR